MKTSKMAWDLLSKSVGSYAGEGVNHEGQRFTGQFKLESAFADKLLTLQSSARGVGGEIYHQEVSWIGFDIFGDLNLYVTSNNHPAVTPHKFDRIEEKEDAKNLIFRFGSPLDQQSFREEITFSFKADGSVAHQYAWGMPGGEFEPRSGARMEKIN